jgi:hypothetical protein
MSQIHNRYATVHGQRLFYREAGQREQTRETEQAVRSAPTLEATRWQYLTRVVDESLVR